MDLITIEFSPFLMFVFIFIFQEDCGIWTLRDERLVDAVNFAFEEEEMLN